MSCASPSIFLEPTAAPNERPRSFDALYEAHFDFVYRCLQRLGVRPATAEDAAQDTFVVLHRRLGDLRPDASERGFLFAIASRVARDYRRKQWRTRTVPLAEEPPARDPGTPLEDLLNAEAARTIERFLATLSEGQRVVFMLMELEEMTAPEVAEALATKLNTVYSRLRLARERFARFVAEEGIR
jgi:RNA polymerase sigma-70 factor (ECF subfamily)